MICRAYFEILQCRSLRWDQIALEDLGRFGDWSRLRVDARGGRVVQMLYVEANLAAVTVNRKLSALASFYKFHQRRGVALGELLTVDAVVTRAARRFVAAVPGSPGSTAGATSGDLVSCGASAAAGIESGGDAYPDRGV